LIVQQQEAIGSGNAEGREYLKEEIKNAINGFMVSGKFAGFTSRTLL